ncbi:PEGA domain-containing protein [Patescibacteria group bacterium]
MRHFLVVIIAFVIAGCGIFDSDQTGTVIVTSEPPDASVYLDGDWTGQTTPATLKEIAIGVHTIEISDHYSESYKEEVTVTENQTTYVDVQIATKLALESNPSGAIIVLNDSVTTYVTPHIFEGLPLSGYYSIRLLKEGHLPHESTWRRQLGDVREISTELLPAPDLEIVYSLGTGKWGDDYVLHTVGFDGMNSAQLFGRSIITEGTVRWSSDGQHLAYNTESGVSIITCNGTFIGEVPRGERVSHDFVWSHDGTMLSLGSYFDGIYLFDIEDQTLAKIVRTNSMVYDHNPAFDPNDQFIAHVQHQWGSDAILYVRDLGGNHIASYGRFKACCDRNMSLTWISDAELLFLADGGVYTFEPYVSGATHQLVVEDAYRNLIVTDDVEQFAYATEDGDIYVGEVGKWTPRFITNLSGIRELHWTPEMNAITCLTRSGIYWITLDRRVYHIVSVNSYSGPAVIYGMSIR